MLSTIVVEDSRGTWMDPSDGANGASKVKLNLNPVEFLGGLFVPWILCVVSFHSRYLAALSAAGRDAYCEKRPPSGDKQTSQGCIGNLRLLHAKNLIPYERDTRSNRAGGFWD